MGSTGCDWFAVATLAIPRPKPLMQSRDHTSSTLAETDRRTFCWQAIQKAKLAECRPKRKVAHFFLVARMSDGRLLIDTATGRTRGRPQDIDLVLCSSFSEGKDFQGIVRNSEITEFFIFSCLLKSLQKARNIFS